MDPAHLTQLLLGYRYWILIPLSLLEGPIVAFVAATLASQGYFNIYALGILFFVRDVGLDGVYYALGHFGGNTKFVKGSLKKLSITKQHLEQVRSRWEKHPAWTMLIGKLSYGIASAFIVVAGIVSMPLSKFFMYGSLVALAQYGTLLTLGYFLGTAFSGEVTRTLSDVQYILFFMGICIAGYYFLTYRMRTRLLDEQKSLEEPA